MTRLTRFTLSAFVVVASIWTAKPADAQDTSKTKSPATTKSEIVITSADSIAISDIQKATEQLVLAVHEAVRKATEDPAVKLAALKVAKNAVTAAQIAVTQQAETLATVLDAMAREIAQATEKQHAKARRH